MDTTIETDAPYAVYQYSTLTADEQIARIAEVITSGRLGSIAGRTVRCFEEQVAARTGRSGAVATTSATAALELLLHCLPPREPRFLQRWPEPAVSRSSRLPLRI